MDKNESRLLDNEKKIQKEKSTAKNTALNIVIILLLATIIVSAVIGLYAWAKYRSSIDGNAEAEVAKWHFELKEGTTESENKLLALTRTDENTTVAKEKVAPGTYGELPIIIDTTKTEVSLVYDLEVKINNYPQNMILKNLEGQVITPLVSGDGIGEKPRIATIKVSKYVPFDTEDSNRLHYETIKWDWPYETGSGDDIIENDKIDTQDAGKEIFVSISVTGTQVLSSTPVSSVTSADYGQYVNIGTSILGKDNEAEADWRVLYEDSTGGVWLMLSDYLPVTDGSVGKSTVSSVGLTTSGTYIVKSNTSRKDLLDKLNGDWSSLISGSDVEGKEGVKVKGAVDLETWVASWNEKYPNNDTYQTNQIYTAKEGMSDEVGYGYKVSREDPATTIEVSMKGSEGYIDKSSADKLYYPHTSVYNNCYGYRLASPSSDTTDRVMSVDSSGRVGCSTYQYAYYGVCPAVYLPSNIKLDTSNAVWTIVNE